MSDTLREALEKITRVPVMPFPDPEAHSYRVFGERVWKAWLEIQRIARAALAKEARDAPRRLPSLMLEWQRVAHSSGWPEEAKRLIDDMLSALLAFVDPHVEIDGKWVREAEARDAGAREEPISGVEFNLRYGHQATCVFGLENSGMCDCGKGFIGAARDAAKETGDERK